MADEEQSREELGRRIEEYLSLTPEQGGPGMPGEDETKTHNIRNIMGQAGLSVAVEIDDEQALALAQLGKAVDEAVGDINDQA